MPILLSLPVSPERDCGECSACCTAKGVESLHKPVYTPCTHLSANGIGCRIYGDHPDECKKYKCLWRGGHIEGDERRRPDKLGLLFELSQGGAFGQPFVIAWEIRPGAMSEDAARITLDKLTKKFLVYIKLYASKSARIMGPPDLVFQFKQLAIDMKLQASSTLFRLEQESNQGSFLD